MEITTKYNLGDKFWWMSANRVYELTISKIDIRIRDEKGSPSIDYGADAFKDHEGDFVYPSVTEKNLHPTKESLIASL